MIILYEWPTLNGNKEALIINSLQEFLLKLGRGFAFVERKVKPKDKNYTVEILLCKNKNDVVAETRILLNIR